MNLHWIIFVLVSMGWVSEVENCTTKEYIESKAKLFQRLGLDNNDYNITRMWPLLSMGTAATIYIDIFVHAIIDVNEKSQSLTTQIGMKTIWPNSNMKWSDTEFCGSGTFVALKSIFWTPDIVISESIKADFGTKESPYVKLYNSGFARTFDHLSLTTACQMDLYKFPFDTQTCNMTIQSSSYSSSHIRFKPNTDPDYMTSESKDAFQSQGEWEFLRITNVTLPDMGQLIYQIIIKRRPLLYVINIIIPVLFFLLLDVISFFASTSASDRLGFKVTLLLSISVLLLILNDTLPSTADKIPLIGIYCCGIFCLIGVSIVETIFVSYLMAKGDEDEADETTATVSGRNDDVKLQQNLPDSVRDQNEDQSCALNCLKQILNCLKQILSECRAATDQNQREKTSLYWTRVARIIDNTFLGLYIIAIIVFLSVLGIIWFHSEVLHL